MKKVILSGCFLVLAIAAVAWAAKVPKRYRTVAPEKVGWKLAGRFPVKMEKPVAIEVDAKGRIYVAGKKKIKIYNRKGKEQAGIGLEFTPTCFTRIKNSMYFVASKDRVWRVPAKYPVKSEPIKGAMLTGLVATEEYLYATDAANRKVWRWKRPFKGGKPEQFTKTKFVVPSPYFDMAVGSDGLLRIVDPGRHRIKHFTEEGQHEKPLDWGKAGFKLDEFPTCCNPAYIALLSDDAVVTVEKKIPRVKVYTLEGKLRSVVVDPTDLIGKRPFNATATKLVVDVAVGPKDVIYLLDPLAKEVLWFEKKKK